MLHMELHRPTNVAVLPARMYPPWTQPSQSSQCAPKAFYSFKNRCLFTVFFLVMHCNYTYIHSGDTPLICASTWANGFRACLLVCAANTRYLSGSQFAAGAPTSPYAQHWSWAGKEEWSQSAACSERHLTGLLPAWHNEGSEKWLSPSASCAWWGQPIWELGVDFRKPADKQQLLGLIFTLELNVLKTLWLFCLDVWTVVKNILFSSTDIHKVMAKKLGNHRITGVRRDLKGSSSPTPLPKQGTLQ